MGFKKLYNFLTVLTIIAFTVVFTTGCSDKVKENTGNTYYIDLVNFTKDSLKQSIKENILGKVAYYDKNSRLQILSVNYVTDDYPNMHYFKSVEDIGSDIKAGTKKIKIEFAGEYTIDSIHYSIQKFVYNNKQWNKISDMGFLKATTTYKRAREFAIKEFAKQIMNNSILDSFD